MNIKITATEKLTSIEGVPVRLWNGVTESGVDCLVFVHRIAVDKNVDGSQFEKELKEQVPPGVKWNLRDIL
jgi:hypothetical protein